ncbi:diguanylate cyclase [Methylophaga sp.]|uniref:GGDEF domain-containing protein n=1 Tax=Methylophaga sp. TaxID=2024840 RepID=UPI003F6A1049
MQDEFDFNFREIVELTNDAIIVTDANIEVPGPQIVYVNPAFTKLTGYSFKEAMGKTPRMLQGEGTSESSKKKIKKALLKQHDIRITLRNYTKSGKEYWIDVSIVPLRDDTGSVTHYAAIQREVTEQKRKESHLEHLSTTDALTGAGNRRALDEKLDALFSERRKQAEFCLLVIDIDNFKPINDKFGHPAGDRYLIELVKTLKSLLRENDFIARTGGEEFCIILPNTDIDSASISAERLRKAIEQLEVTESVENYQIQATISLGVSQRTIHDESVESIFERADKALYEAKESGKNQYKISRLKRKQLAE